MSFKCDFCGQAAPPNTPKQLVVTKTRHRRYWHRNGPDTEGTEIVQEKAMCLTCHNAEPEQVAQRFNDGKTYLHVDKERYEQKAS